MRSVRSWNLERASRHVRERAGSGGVALFSVRTKEAATTPAATSSPTSLRAVHRARSAAPRAAGSGSTRRTTDTSRTSARISLRRVPSGSVSGPLCFDVTRAPHYYDVWLGIEL